MDDLGFVQRCVKGDKRAWDEFVDKYSRLIYNYIYNVLNTKGRAFTQDNAQDIFQEIFYSLIKDNFKKLSTFKARNGCSLASWLRQVTINHTIDYIRKTKLLISIDAENEEAASLKEIMADGSAAVTDKLTNEEKLAHLKDCIESLEKQDRYFLELHINRGLELGRLKDHLKVSRAAVDMRKSRIIERLRECFKGKGFRLDF